VVAVIAVLPSSAALAGGMRWRVQAQPVVAVIAVLPSPDVWMKLADGCVPS
jgi:type IV secretory pathway VirB2 component (pilin)